jgi:hypothetical protein
MTTRIARAALAILALVSAGFTATALTAAPANAAEYCVYTDPAHVGDKPITPPGEYCVPGP